MRYSFRLAQLLGYDPNPYRRPGIIKAIVQHTGLDRHQVSALLKNEMKYIPLHALSRICDFLVGQGYATPDQLPGALFAVEAEDFWELLARRNRLELCVGVRSDDEQFPETAWIVASDALLIGELLNGVSTLGGTAAQRYPSGQLKPHPEQLRQQLVWSPGHRRQDEVEARAQEVYDDFCRAPGDKGLLCIGSIKSNPVTEIILAEAFGCKPFASQDGLSQASQRTCPFFLRYRNIDPHVPSCCGGLELAGNMPSDKPGIYYELPDGTWQVAEWVEGQRDAAYVFYVYHEALGRLEMALGGFSGRSTRFLAKTLAARSQDFWPPVYSEGSVSVGAFIVQYWLADAQSTARDILRTDLTAQAKVIPLASQVIQRRVKWRSAHDDRTATGRSQAS